MSEPVLEVLSRLILCVDLDRYCKLIKRNLAEITAVSACEFVWKFVLTPYIQQPNWEPEDFMYDNRFVSMLLSFGFLAG